MTLSKVLLATSIAMGALSVPTISASAAVACTGNVCWHVGERYQYPRNSRVIIHEDNWRPRGRVIFREHEGRGYWRGREWRSW